MEDHLWIHLKRNEPTAVELTKQEYENNRGFGSQGGESVVYDKDVPEPVGKDTAQKYVSPVSGESLKKEIIAEILKRGTDIPEKRLKMKNKADLLDLL